MPAVGDFGRAICVIVFAVGGSLAGPTLDGTQGPGNPVESSRCADDINWLLAAQHSLRALDPLAQPFGNSKVFCSSLLGWQLPLPIFEV